MMDKRVVITGIGIISAIGIDKNSFWNNLNRGISGQKKATVFDTQDSSGFSACRADEFDPLNYLPRQGLHYFTRSAQLGIACAISALKDAAIEVTEQNRYAIGEITGSTYCSFSCARSLDLEAKQEGPNFINPLNFPNTMETMTASNIAIKLGIKGLQKTISNSETSALDALALGMEFIRDNALDMVLAGGVEELTPELLILLKKLNLLSATDKAIPFSDIRDGMIAGEGSVFIVLEEYQHAVTRGARIYAEIIDYAQTFDPEFEKGNGEGIKSAVIKIMERQGIAVHELGFVCAGANGSIIGDKNEKVALQEIFEDSPMPVFSIKGLTGECFSAGGGMQVVAALLSMEMNKLPASVPFLEYETDVAAKMQHKVNGIYSLITSFGFRGNSTAVLLKKYNA
jgi:3-oxoacyl-[acyl-carrier-protein] synthase II